MSQASTTLVEAGHRDGVTVDGERQGGGDYASQMRNDGSRPTSLSGNVILVFQIVVYTFWLKGINLYSRRALTGTCDVDVSLTTFGRRTRRVWRTVETIGRGVERPRRLVLWLDDAAVVNNPPRSLRRLMRRGLELRTCVDYGPHKKYFPHVMQHSLDRPLVTADDDVLYPRGWLESLHSAHRPEEVTAYRARTMNSGPYSSWPLCTTNEPSKDLVPTGVSGVIYPPKVLLALRERGDEFMQICPRADDLWLHFAAVASGVLSRQVSETASAWWPVRPKERGLWHENLANGGNDYVVETVAQAWLPAADGTQQS